ncbi:MAG TPA: response regulator [Phototrophicaceae bacterium]|nr:response regulator [Phototrophicaceae bacterium]
MNILYLEDNQNDANLVSRYIDTTGHQLKVVTNQEEARRAMQKQNFDLVLVDVMLGTQRSGADFARELRNNNYNGSLIGVTALTSAQDKAQYQQIGFDFVLSKPFTIMELANLLERYLS